MFEKALELGPRDALTVGMLAYGYAALGKPERARALHAELERRAVDQFVSPVGRVFTAAAVGDRQAALQRLEEALSGSGSLPHLYR